MLHVSHMLLNVYIILLKSFIQTEVSFTNDKLKVIWSGSHVLRRDSM